MRNLWLFISKYNAFFLLLIFLILSLTLLVNHNTYQRASTLNSSNQVIGETYERVNHVKEYLTLGKTNDSLAAENARLRDELKQSFFNDSIQKRTVNDTITKQQYTYIVAHVVNNSIRQRNNYLTINRGSKHGIKKGMGVICASGVVGIVENISEHYSTIRSLLHSGTLISASLIPSNAFGSLAWDENNLNPRIATLKDIPNHIIVKKGGKVVTSGHSGLFPQGIEIGKVIKTGITGGDSFLNIEVQLNTDFSTLQYVYVISNLLANEETNLETQNKTQ